jgi:hypothetical protein
MSNQILMLTTTDNPFNPITDYELWESFDKDHGYYTQEYLARVAIVHTSMSDQEVTEEIVRAMNAIIDNDPTNLYKLVGSEISNIDNKEVTV